MSLSFSKQRRSARQTPPVERSASCPSSPDGLHHSLSLSLDRASYAMSTVLRGKLADQLQLQKARSTESVALRTPMSRSHQAVHETRGDHPYPEMVPHQPQNTRHSSRRAETREDRTARRRDACKASATESSFLAGRLKTVHHFGSARSVNVCKPANELSSTKGKIHPSAPPVSDNHVCKNTLTRGEREKEPCPSEPHTTHTRKNL